MRNRGGWNAPLWQWAAVLAVGVVATPFVRARNLIWRWRHGR